MSQDNFISISPLSTDKPHRAKGSGFRRAFLIEKLNNPIGYILLFLVSAGLAVGVGIGGMKFGILAIVIMVAVPALYALVVYPIVGMTIFLVMAYFLLYILKLGVNFPLGTAMDGMEALFILGLLIQQRKKKDWSMFKGPITTMVLIWIGYNLLEFANPVAESRAAWVYTVRSVAVIMIMYFVFLYNVRTIEVVRFLLKLWLALALIAALYAFKQQYIGFTSFEQAYLDSDPEVAELLFIGGVWRKFSIFSDPVVFAYTMVVSSLLCVGILTGPISAFKPSDDASFNLRKRNQKRIQPYIQTHPMGGGLGATGVWGLKFAPNSYLAHFPPDSGYVRVAVENGWIGLLLLCLFIFIALRTGINNYYLIKDPELKSYCLGFILVIFAFNIGNYPQEALVQYPSNVNFYMTIALIGVVMRLDKQKNQLLNGSR